MVDPNPQRAAVNQLKRSVPEPGTLTIRDNRSGFAVAQLRVGTRLAVGGANGTITDLSTGRVVITGDAGVDYEKAKVVPGLQGRWQGIGFAVAEVHSDHLVLNVLGYEARTAIKGKAAKKAFKRAKQRARHKDVGGRDAVQGAPTT